MGFVSRLVVGSVRLYLFTALVGIVVIVPLLLLFPNVSGPTIGVVSLVALLAALWWY